MSVEGMVGWCLCCFQTHVHVFYAACLCSQQMKVPWYAVSSLLGVAHKSQVKQDSTSTTPRGASNLLSNRQLERKFGLLC